MKARLAAVLAVAIVSVSAVSAQASASTLPVVYGMPYGHVGSNFVHGKIRPLGILSWTGDGSAWFVIHSYNWWSDRSAWGSATLHARSCWGPCFRYATEHAKLHFFRVRIHRGQRYFTRVRFILRHKVAGLTSATLRFYSHGIPAWYR